MKLLGGFLTECINIMLVMESKTSTDVVKNFVAMGILAEIDNIIGATLKNVDLEDECGNANIYYKKQQDLISFKIILTNYIEKKISPLYFTM